MINKSGSSITASLNLSGFSGKAKAKLYRYSGAHKTSIRALEAVAVHAKKVRVSYPGSSISLLVIPRR